MSKRFTDYAFRSEVLKLNDSEGILKYYKLYSRVEYCKAYNLRMPIEYHPEYDDNLFEYFQAFYPAEWEECEKICKTDKSRSLRLKYKVKFLITYYAAFFITLTFTDSVFATTSEATRRRYVSRFLNTLNCPYIANIDFGDLHGREHYHAIIGCRLPKSKLFDWIFNYGTVYAQRVRRSVVGSIRLSKYVSKLCNHAIKETCKRGSLLFSRKFKLPSTAKEYASFEKIVAPILDKGNVLSIAHTAHTQQKRRLSTMRTKQSFTTRIFTKYCAQCGSLIADAVDNQYGYAIEKTVNGNITYVYFCPDCIRKYNIQTITRKLTE